MIIKNIYESKLYIFKIFNYKNQNDCCMEFIYNFL